MSKPDRKGPPESLDLVCELEEPLARLRDFVHALRLMTALGEEEAVAINSFAHAMDHEL
jgi:hypothetical protein